MARAGTIRTAASALMLVAAMSGCGPERKAVPQAEASTKRTTTSGDVVGYRADYESDAWLGIPYAKAPVGALRWRAPQSPTAWTGVRESLSFGSPCVQYASEFGGVTTAKPGTPVGSEDCLFLNIWSPRFAVGAPPKQQHLPVMLWIHGGGNTIGESGFYNGGNLAASQRVIVVSANYRLGPFGWFRHASLRDADSTELDQSGNFGTLDLVRSLEWVRDNIAEFGGDPGNVTIFGESAGGTNVYSLLLAPQAKGLFHRAIVESGGFFFNDAIAAENLVDDSSPGEANSSNEALLRFLMKDGAADRAAAKARLAAMRPADIEKLLRGKSAFDVLSAYSPMNQSGMIRMPLLTREGTVLPQAEALSRFAAPDGYNRVPVILGTNRDENKLFMQADPMWVRHLIGLRILPRIRDERMYNLTAEYMAKWWKAAGVDEPATTMAASAGPGVYAYRFDWDEEPTLLGADLSVLVGAGHGLEIPFVFGHFDLGRAGDILFSSASEPGRLALSKQMMSYWAQFARTGSPGKGQDGQLPEWQAWDPTAPTAPKFVVLDTAAGGGVRMSADSVTRAGLIDAIAKDSRLASQLEKCRIYHDLAQWNRGFTGDQYTKAGCANFPFDKYPWTDAN